MNPRAGGRPTRREFLGYAAAFTAGLGVAGAVAGCGGGGVPVIRLAAGEVGGFYHAFAQLLSRVAAEGGLRIDPITTAGSLENLSLLAAGNADAALVLADSITSNQEPPPAIGRVYENYLQVAVRADGRLESMADLRGARINLGAAGSGATRTGEKLLLAAGLALGELTITHLPLREAAEALLAGRLDALLWAGGVPTPALADARLRLLDLGALTTPMRDRFGYLYDPVLIPAGTYPGSAAVQTIGVANLLVAAAGLAERTAAALTRLLLTRADALIPAEAAGTQFLTARSLIGTGTVPLHPGAAAVYREFHG
ncbi:TAXI family TRAP transporter solute-binding subunit [Nocardia sp. IFM 10818]